MKSPFHHLFSPFLTHFLLSTFNFYPPDILPPNIYSTIISLLIHSTLFNFSSSLLLLFSIQSPLFFSTDPFFTPLPTLYPSTLFEVDPDGSMSVLIHPFYPFSRISHSLNGIIYTLLSRLVSLVIFCINTSKFTPYSTYSLPLFSTIQFLLFYTPVFYPDILFYLPPFSILIY